MDKTLQELSDKFSEYVIEIITKDVDEGDFDEKLTLRLSIFEEDHNCQLTIDEINFAYNYVNDKVNQVLGTDMNVFDK